MHFVYILFVLIVLFLVSFVQLYDMPVPNSGFMQFINAYQIVNFVIVCLIRLQLKFCAIILFEKPDMCFIKTNSQLAIDFLSIIVL